MSQLNSFDPSADLSSGPESIQWRTLCVRFARLAHVLILPVLAVPALLWCCRLVEPEARGEFISSAEPVVRDLRRASSLEDVAEVARSIPRVFEAHYAEHFGLRRALIEAENDINRWLGHSPSYALVGFGDDDWLFYRGDTALPYQRARPLSRAWLSTFAARLEERRAYLQSLGTRFVFFITPSKPSIYAEELPDEMQPVWDDSPAEQLVAYLKAHTSITVVYPKRQMLRAKQRHRLYDKTDTHWNGWGRYVGYEALFETLSGWFPELSPAPPQQYRPLVLAYQGDLGAMVGQGPERVVRLRSDEPSATEGPLPVAGFESLVDAHDKCSVQAFTNPGATRTAIMSRDSFGYRQQRLISAHFKHVVYLPTDEFPRELIVEQGPDVFIEQRSERSLVRGLAPLP